MVCLCNDFGAVQGFACPKPNDEFNTVISSKRRQTVYLLRRVSLYKFGIANFETSSLKSADDLFPGYE